MLILKPAYGRDYKNWDEVLNDWKAGMDFTTEWRQYVNKSDFEVFVNLKLIKTLSFVYCRGTKTTIINREDIK